MFNQGMHISSNLTMASSALLREIQDYGADSLMRRSPLICLLYLSLLIDKLLLNPGHVLIRFDHFRIVVRRPLPWHIGRF